MHTPPELRVLVVGLGSMGKRRVRNLLANGIRRENIIGIDCRADRLEEAMSNYDIEVHEDLADIKFDAIDALIISTPPDQHLSYAEIAVNYRKHVFIEASVVSNGLLELAQKVDAAKVVAFPSCTMRFFPGPRRVTEILRRGEIGRPLVWQYQSGQYLPDWHPWEPIQEFYVSNPITGGCREIVPFELNWLESVFGRIDDMEARCSKISDLSIAIDDVYMLQMRHQGGVLGQLLVDVLSRPAVRHLRIVGSEGTLDWDDEGKIIKVYKASSGQWHYENVGAGTIQKNYINPEEPYIEEVRTFLECIRRNQAPSYSLLDDVRVLGLLISAEASAKSGVRVRI